MRARDSLALPAPLAALAGLLLLTAGAASAQPAFGVEAVARRAESGAETRLDVYAAVPHTSLRFLARAGGFRASYGLTAQVYAADDRGRRGRLVATRTTERAVAAADYDATQSPDLQDRPVLTMTVPPGRYVVAVAVEDGASGRALTSETAHTVRDLAAGAVTLSDPLLLSAYEPGGASTPIVGATVSTEQDAFWVASDVYADAARALRVSYVVTEAGRERERPSFGALLGLAPRQRAEAGTPVAVTEPLTTGPGVTPAAFRVATGGLQVGDYTLTVRLADAAGQTLAEATKPFAVRWTGLDGQIADLDQAVAQLRYLAQPDEVAAIRGAPTPEAQRRQFLAFWRGRYPDAGAAREAMSEYYFRVASADERYGRFQDRGWATDRGEVFIRFGEPEAVEDHPVDYGTKPYQIWSYPSRGRRFIFVDETGSGDFELLVPIWDDRTRM